APAPRAGQPGAPPAGDRIGLASAHHGAVDHRRARRARRARRGPDPLPAAPPATRGDLSPAVPTRLRGLPRSPGSPLSTCASVRSRTTPAGRVDPTRDRGARVIWGPGEHERVEVEVAGRAVRTADDPQGLAGVVAVEAGPGAVRLRAEPRGPHAAPHRGPGEATGGTGA